MTPEELAATFGTSKSRYDKPPPKQAPPGETTIGWLNRQFEGLHDRQRSFQSGFERAFGADNTRDFGKGLDPTTGAEIPDIRTAYGKSEKENPKLAFGGQVTGGITRDLMARNAIGSALGVAGAVAPAVAKVAPVFKQIMTSNTIPSVLAQGAFTGANSAAAHEASRAKTEDRTAAQVAESVGLGGILGTTGGMFGHRAGTAISGLLGNPVAAFKQAPFTQATLNAMSAAKDRIGSYPIFQGSGAPNLAEIARATGIHDLANKFAPKLEKAAREGATTKYSAKIGAGLSKNVQDQIEARLDDAGNINPDILKQLNARGSYESNREAAQTGLDQHLAAMREQAQRAKEALQNSVYKGQEILPQKGAIPPAVERIRRDLYDTDVRLGRDPAAGVTKGAATEAAGSINTLPRWQAALDASPPNVRAMAEDALAAVHPPFAAAKAARDVSDRFGGAVEGHRANLNKEREAFPQLDLPFAEKPGSPKQITVGLPKLPMVRVGLPPRDPTSWGAAITQQSVDQPMELARKIGWNSGPQQFGGLTAAQLATIFGPAPIKEWLGIGD